jgi:hypothetical protein
MSTTNTPVKLLPANPAEEHLRKEAKRLAKTRADGGMAVHKHSTPAHPAVANDDPDMLKLLVEHGARLDVADTLWRSTPAGWASLLKKSKCAALLASLAEAPA